MNGVKIEKGTLVDLFYIDGAFQARNHTCINVFLKQLTTGLRSMSTDCYQTRVFK